MKKILDGASLLVRGFVVVISLVAGGVILVLASLLEKLQGVGR